MDKINVELKCELCDIILPNDASMQQHKLGQKHLKIFNAKEEQRRVEQKCGIYVRGYPNYLGQDVILAYFANYGAIVWTHFGHNFLLLDFSEPCAVEKIMKKPQHRLEGRLLTIKYRELRVQRLHPKVKMELEDNTSILEELKNSLFLYQQVKILNDCLQGGMITPIHLSKYNKICRDLHLYLRNAFPRCHIYPFGSSLTGLYFWNSDVDIYISGIRGDNEDDIGYLFKLKKILNNSQIFSNSIVIGQAKIPILKCIHTPSNTNCDINIRNLLGVCNSRLISYYIGIDPKIKDMMMIIKYWAKIHKMTGQNHLFTNYSLCLMIIFYLQGNPYNLPSVKHLQSDPQFIVLQDVWNGGFKNIPSYCPHIKSSPILNLLKNFFAYYENFNYNIYVISPYLGKCIEKNDFKNPDNLPPYFNGYKKFVSLEKNKPLKFDNFICVQDPFEHSRNTTPILSETTLNIFIKFCQHAKNLCEIGEKSLLYKILTESPPNIDVELLTLANFTQFGINMNRNNNKSINEWFLSVKEFTLMVLKKFLNMEIEENNSGPSSSKKLKIDGGNNLLIIDSFKCSAKLNIWNSRKIILKNTNNQFESFIDKEIEITKQLINLYKDINLTSNIIEFDVVLEKKLEPAQVIFNLTKISSYKKTFKSFGEFFAKKFPAWFEMYEKHVNVQ